MKTCNRCGETKPLDDYYGPVNASGGKSGPCKVCVRKASAARLRMIMQDAELAKKELERQRQKTKRRTEAGLVSKLPKEKKAKYLAKYFQKYPEKKAALSVMWAAINRGELEQKPCEVCGKEKAEGHHDDYSKPLDVIWLCSKHHAERHVQLRREELTKRLTDTEAA